MPGPVAALLAPRSVAIVGASNNPLKRGHQALRRLIADGFAGEIYPVNPRESQVLGLAAHPSVAAIDGPVDLVLVTTPAHSVPGVLRDCGAKGVAAAVVIATGFREAGDAGRSLEEETVDVARAHGIGLVGPNTNGVFNLPLGLNLVGAPDVPVGGVALLCQSGNVGLSLFTQAAHEGALGFSSYVGIGNEAGLGYHDVLDHLRDDPGTQAVLVYAEGFRDGRAFLRSAERLARSKPVVCYKAGRTEAAQRSALSHTGAVAGSPRVADALLRQAGVVAVDRSDELLAVTEALLRQPPLASPSVAVLTDGGGHGTIAADALGGLGLSLPALDPSTRSRLAAVLPAAASTGNPVDVAGAADQDPRAFVPALEALLDDPGVAGVLCVGLLGGYSIRFDRALAEAEEEAAAHMAAAAAERGKALIVHSAYAPATPRSHALLREAGVPVLGAVETAARAMAALAARGGFLATADARSALPVLTRRRMSPYARALPEPAGRALLARYGLSTGQWVHAVDPDAAARASREIGAPVAIKVVSPDITHKSDVGGVELDVRSPEEARRAFERIRSRVVEARPSARLDGVLVAPMAPSGVELMVGASTDPTFGPLLAVGAGGTAVEVLADTAFRAIPATARDCAAMLGELRSAPLLDGFRGAAPVDRSAIVELLRGVSGLVAAESDVLELDLNPVIAHPTGLAIVDVRVVIATGHGGAGATGAQQGAERATAAHGGSSSAPGSREPTTGVVEQAGGVRIP